MERLDSLSEQSLCLQDLVSSAETSQMSHMSHHHVAHDSLAGLSAVTAATTVLGHHGLHDGHHVGHHAPPLLSHHEPLEKLKRGKMT